MIRKFSIPGFVVFYLLCLSLSFAQNFSATINTSGGTAGIEYDLTFGFSPEATDGYDEGIDLYAPPAPPPPAFDAALSWGGDRYYTQILAGDGDLSEHIYDIALAYPSDNLITVTWDNTGWDVIMTSAILQDAFGGAFVNIDMITGEGFANPAFASWDGDVLSIFNSAVNTLKLKITPAEVSANPPTASFSVDPLIGNAGLTVFTFTDGSIGDAEIISWDWNFGDGGTSTEQNPSHTYGSAGTYTVSLMVGDANALSDAVTMEDLIIVIPSTPIADLGPDTTIYEFSEIILGGDSYDPDGNISVAIYSNLDDDDYTIESQLYYGSVFAGEDSTYAFMAPEFDSVGDMTFTIGLELLDNENTMGYDTVVVTIQNLEIPPVAEAGVDNEAFETYEYQLDGSGSSDDMEEHGHEISYLWTAHSSIVFNYYNIDRPIITLPELVDDTQFTITLTVTDNDGLTDSDDVIITVRNIQAGFPLANAGDDEIVDEGQTVTMDGSSSIDQAERDIVSYLWSSIDPQIVFDNEDSVITTFTAPGVIDDTEFALTLTVTDNDGNQLSDIAIVTVLNVNQPPVVTFSRFCANVNADDPDTVVITFGDTLVVTDGDLLYLETESTDPDGGVTFYTWSALPTTNFDGSGISFSPTDSAYTDLSLDVNDTSYYSISLTILDSISGPGINYVQASGSNSVVIKVKFVNKPPTTDIVFSAGLDPQVVVEGEEVRLDAEGSDDPDNQELFYTWTQPGEQDVTLSDTNAEEPRFIAPAVTSGADTLTFYLTVDDGDLSVLDTVLVPVLNNIPPWAGMSIKQGNTAVDTVFQGVEIKLDGSSSGDNTDVSEIYGDLTYLWTVPNNITLSDNTAEKPTFNAPDVTNTTDFIFSLVVNDGEFNSESVSDTLTVLGNVAPIANAGASVTVVEGIEVTLDGTGSDDLNNDELSFTWTSPSGIDSLSSYSAREPRFFAPAEDNTTSYIFTLVVSDGIVISVPDTVVVTIITNERPVALADVHGDTAGHAQGAEIKLKGTASDDTDVSDVYGGITFLWTPPTGIQLSNTTLADPIFTAPQVGESQDTLDFILVVNDGELNSSPDTVTIIISGNQPPSVDAGNNQQFYVANSNLPESSGIDITVSLNGTASDVNNDNLTSLWTNEQGEGIALSDSLVLNPSFTVPADVEIVEYIFRLTVSDGETNSSAVTLVSILENEPPAADAGEDQTVDQGVGVTLSGQGLDDTDVSNLYGGLTYNWTVPPGISLSSLTAASPDFTAPLGEDTTRYTFYFVVNDGEFNSTPDSVTVTILPNKPPSVNAGSDQEVDQGTIVTLDGSASSDPNNDELEFHWAVWSSPVEITLSDTSAAKPTFTAPDRDEISYYVFLLTVNDGFVDSEADHSRHDSPAKVTVTVLKNKPPVAVAGSNKRGYKGNSVMLSGTESTDINFDGITFKWFSNDTLFSEASSPYFYLPNDLSQNTEYTFHLMVTDEHGESSQVDTMVISALVDSVAAPDVPNVYITAEHRKVIVSWDASAEDSKDPFSGYSDFEGYKVYKSTDGGATWGGSQNKIYDYYGNFVGWRPIAQFDYTEAQDTSRCIYENSFGCEDGVRREEISGLDPMAPRINLGSNNGLQHSFIDSNVVDGFEYTYSVTSYDMGLRTYIHTYQFIFEKFMGEDSLFLVENPECEGTSEDENCFVSIYKDSTEWFPSNPDRGIFGPDSLPVYGAYRSLECAIGSSDLDPNFVSIIPGYKASNITFPDIEKAEEFIVPNQGTIGNGNKFYAIVDEGLLTDDLLRYEIQAELLMEDVNKDGIIETKSNTDDNMDFFSGYPTENPLLFAYKVVDTLSQLPVNVGNEYSISSLSTTQQDSLMDLPGADSLSGMIRLPQYTIEAFPLKYLDDTDYESNWSDIFDGIRLRFDNTLGNNLLNFPAVISKQYSYPDTGLINILDIKLEYGNQGNSFNQRPPYSYKIEFSTSMLDTAQEVTPSGGCAAAHEGFNTILPFRITNLTTGKRVPVRVMDNGLDGKTATNDDGEGDCVWERGEEIHFTFDSVKTTFGEDGRLNTQDDDIPFPNYTFILKLDFKYYNYFTRFIEPWKDDTTYTLGAEIKHEGMIWQATGTIPMGTDPVSWMDDGNGNNINPWEIQYYWNDGDYIIIEPTRWYKDGDSWIADMSLLGKSHAVTQESLELINVVPNPYIVQSWFQTPQNPTNRLRFINLPQQCRITIYTITGERVVTLDHYDEYDSNEWWDLKNGSGRDIAPGLYIYTVEAGDLTPHIGKFAVVR